MDRKHQVRQRVLDSANSLVELSHRVHAHPETNFAEVQSSGFVKDALSQAGFSIEPVADLPTAFVARYGTGSLHIGICAEYDALPGIGHACGHNIIAAAAVGAALGLAPLVDDLDLTISVFGTPAEEGGGGKIFMLQKGVFDGIHAAMMVHPAPIERQTPRTLAVSTLSITVNGRAAHAAASPERGLSASAALTAAQVGIALLREHLHEGDRLHGIVTKGGDAPNIVPSQTTGLWYVRSTSTARLSELKPRVVDVFKGAAMMTGCSLEITHDGPLFSELITDADMASLWQTNLAELGRASLPAQTTDGLISTDMGNVSQAIPTIHPLLAIDSGGSNIHEAGFERAAVNESADKAVLDGAIGMAWTAIDLATNPSLRTRLLSRSYAVADAGDAAYLDYRWDEVATYNPAH